MTPAATDERFCGAAATACVQKAIGRPQVTKVAETQDMEPWNRRN